MRRNWRIYFRTSPYDTGELPACSCSTTPNFEAPSDPQSALESRRIVNSMRPSSSSRQNSTSVM
jgi:hypothetical protein